MGRLPSLEPALQGLRLAAGLTNPGCSAPADFAPVLAVDDKALATTGGGPGRYCIEVQPLCCWQQAAIGIAFDLVGARRSAAVHPADR